VPLASATVEAKHSSDGKRKSKCTLTLSRPPVIWFILSFLASSAVAIVAYAQARNFVTRRLRYVDAVQSAFAPFIAGAAAAIIAMPLVAFIPLVGMGTALTLGLSVGLGVASGARDVRNQLPGY
jgi:hypothetical protein